jgi:SEC-C motif-containing protein
MSVCHCGSGLDYTKCCEPIITGAVVAETAEKQLRARYSAFVVHEVPFIMSTVHPDKVKEYDERGIREWSEKSEWLGMEIRATDKGGAADEEGRIDFVARYRQGGLPQEHHELAEFRKQDGKWYFWDGHFVKPETVRREQPKVGRNDPCSCGSGKKFKKCCGA